METVRRVLVACKGSLGDVLPVVRLLQDYRVHYNAHNTGADAATGTPSPLALELVVLSHIDIEPRVRELVGCRDGVKIAWLPFPTTFVEVGKLRDDDAGRQKALQREFTHCVGAIEGQANVDLIVFNLFTLEAWLISKHHGIPSLAVTPFVPMTPLPADVASAIDSEHPGFLSRLDNTLPGCVTGSDFRLWLWRTMLDDFGECCLQHEIDPCPLVSALSSCSATPRSSREPSAEPSPKRRPSSLYRSDTEGLMQATTLLLVCCPWLVPLDFIISDGTNAFGPFTNAVPSDVAVTPFRSQPACSPCRDKSSEETGLTSEITSFLSKFSTAPVFCGFGAMDQLNVLSVSEWKAFLIDFVSVLRHLSLPLLVHTKAKTNLHVALCQMMLKYTSPLSPSTVAAHPGGYDDGGGGGNLHTVHTGDTSSVATCGTQATKPEPNEQTHTSPGHSGQPSSQVVKANAPSTVDHYAMHRFVRSMLCVFTCAVDYALLFPRCLMLCHHAGAGIAKSAILSHRPQLLFPMLFDQVTNAECLEGHDVGVHVGHPATVTRASIMHCMESCQRLESSLEVSLAKMMSSRTGSDIAVAYDVLSSLLN